MVVLCVYTRYVVLAPQRNAFCLCYVLIFRQLFQSDCGIFSRLHLNHFHFNRSRAVLSKILKKFTRLK